MARFPFVLRPGAELVAGLDPFPPMLIEIDGIGIALIRKCASSAIRRAINKSGKGVYRDVSAERFAALPVRLVTATRSRNARCH